MFCNALQFLHTGYAFYSSVFTRAFRRFNWHTSPTGLESSVLSSMDGYLQNEPDPPPGLDRLGLGRPGLDRATSIAAPRAIVDATFSSAVEKVEAFVKETFSREIEQQQLYYHGWDHVNGVARRARLIFDTVVDCCKGDCSDLVCSDLICSEGSEQLNQQSIEDYWDRQRKLLQLSAIAHDMLQIFSPQHSPHTPRQRQSGHSEKATIDKLIEFIEQSNQAAFSTAHQSQSSNSRFSSTDMATIREAIEATVCQYDPVDGSIYQPLLYSQHRDQKSISLVAHCIALADIGTLGIEGLNAYTKEGSLLLLEENLDILAFVQNSAIENETIEDETIENETEFDDAFKEDIRQRLLRRARFQVSFAKGRLARLDKELEGLPKSVIAQIKRDVFKHLTPVTIQTIEAISPTAEDTSLTDLLDYFQLKEIVANADDTFPIHD